MKKFIILCIALFATPAIAQTINWYVDNEIYQTTTCSGGDDVTPPSAPARRGYTFTGWRDTSIIIGTWAQSGSPTPDNPTYPTFYQDGDLILRAVAGNDLVADIYSASTGIITRRIGVKVLDGVTAGAKIGTAWNSTYKRGSFAVSDMKSTAASVSDALSSHFEYSQAVYDAPTVAGFCTNNGTIFISFLGLDNVTSADTANAWLADQYAAGTPVIVIYPLATATLENYTPNANLE